MTSLPRILGVFLAVLLPVLALSGAGAGAAFAEDAPPLPPDTARFTGYPPYRPLDLRAEAALRGWCGACIATGRTQRGSRLGGDLLAAAADVLDARLNDHGDADALYAEGAAAYPPDDPSIGLLLLGWAGHASRRGNTAKVGRLLEQIRPWCREPRPRDLTLPDAHRWDLLAAACTTMLPTLEATWLERNGRLLEAATRLGDLARSDPGGDPRGTAWLWERIARLRYRGGAPEDALAAIDRALALREQDDAAVASLRFWRLQAAHGLLDARAAPSMTAHWPGGTYDDEVRAYLRGIQGAPGITTRYLTLASSALAAGRLATALEIYDLAMRDPTVLEAARHAPLVWRGLLPAWQAALGLGRYDEAEQLLDRIERIADEPLPEKDAFRVEIRKRREADLARAATPGPSPPTTAPPPVGPRRPGGIQSGDERPNDADPIDTGPTDVGSSAPRAAPRAGSATWPWLLALASLVLVLVVVVWWRRGS